MNSTTAFNELQNLIEKCSSDSPTFSLLMDEIRKENQNGAPEIRLIAETNSLGLGLTKDNSDMSIIYIDVLAMRVYPNPIKLGFNDFEKFANTPVWATVACAIFGHELKEVLLDLMANKRDYAKHHPIAVTIEDQIMFDYYQQKRIRGEDCGRDHGNHWDILIEIKGSGVEIYHKGIPYVIYDQTGKPLMQSNRSRLSHITYSNEDYPGRQAGSPDCN
ncbi:hypothetical protein [Ekhidna sp.]|uniref:hypothetical protein n=1 Tax=Ekhidna sp. TaxID=2608089 RepID=UPI0032EAD475